MRTDHVLLIQLDAACDVQLDTIFSSGIALQIIRNHRLEREAEYAERREREWERALEKEAHRHRSSFCQMISCHQLLVIHQA